MEKGKPSFSFKTKNAKKLKKALQCFEANPITFVDQFGRKWTAIGPAITDKAAAPLQNYKVRFTYEDLKN